MKGCRRDIDVNRNVVCISETDCVGVFFVAGQRSKRVHGGGCGALLRCVSVSRSKTRIGLERERELCVALQRWPSTISASSSIRRISGSTGALLGASLAGEKVTALGM